MTELSGASFAIKLRNGKKVRDFSVTDLQLQSEFFNKLSESDKYQILSKDKVFPSFVKVGLVLVKKGIWTEADYDRAYRNTKRLIKEYKDGLKHG